MDSRPIDPSAQSKQKAKAERKNRLAIIFILIGLFATLTLTVINEPLWTFGLAGGLILIVVLLYTKEIFQSLKNRK
jgi:fatty acid desaturase